VEPPLPEPLIARLRETNEAWKAIPGRFERGFTVGRFDRETLSRTPVSLAEFPDGAVKAFVNWVPSRVPGEATIDLIRRCPDAPNGTLDALVTCVLLEARTRGFDRFDLGFAPLAGLDGDPIAHPAERFLRRLRGSGLLVARQRAIEAWKGKFNPRWEPRWLVYRGGPIAFARAAWAVRRIARER
jgi:phosphatidylglycerol lysyltransferase